jgi:hypothetical protein
MERKKAQPEELLAMRGRSSALEQLVSAPFPTSSAG